VSAPRTGEPSALRHPTLLSSCALAATAAEARFRITAAGFPRRGSRVIALDGQSAGIVRDIAARSWNGGHFLVFESAVPGDALLRHVGGGTALLSEELDGADTVVMIASAGAAPDTASIIGEAAAARAIMSAGLVLPGGAAPGEVVSALRQAAMVLVVLRDASDAPEILSALRV
jgi:hypothetical protein